MAQGTPTSLPLRPRGSFTVHSLQLQLSLRSLSWLWVVMMVAHASSAGVLAILTCYFCILGKPEMEYYASFLNDQLPDLRVFAIPFGVLAAMHANVVAGGLVLSLWKQEPTFARQMWLANLVAQLFSVVPVNATRVAPDIESFPWPARCRLARPMLVMIKHARQLLQLVFDVDSSYFFTVHMIREAIEVIAQVVQAYSASVLVSHSYVNHLLVVVLVINSWSTPIIHRVMRMDERQTSSDVAIARATCLLVDAFLNAVSCMGVPMVLLVPFWRDFDWETYGFSLERLYDDVYFARIATESQMIATGTVLGLCMKLVPHVSVYLCLYVIGKMAQLEAVRSNARTTEVKRTIVQPRIAIAERAPNDAQSYVEDTQHAAPRSRINHRHHFSIVAQIAFMTTGLVVLSIHIAAHASAHRSAHDSLCDLVVAPWFTTKYPCLVYTYDCEALNDTTARDGYLSFLDERALLTLNIAHCSNLVVPTDIRRFSNLLGINLMHLTLVDWPIDAALSPELHSSMLFLVFSYVNLSSIPKALLTQLPDKLQDIEMSHTNLSVIPDDLGEHWPNVGTLFFDFCEIKDIPESLMRINLFDLSLIGNHLEDVSVLSRLPGGTGRVLLDHNPLRVLPESFEDVDIVLMVFSIEYTPVMTVPLGLTTNIEQLFMVGTPCCANASNSELQVPMAVDCHSDYFRSNGSCPLT